jgi:hypothetical protein
VPAEFYKYAHNGTGSDHLLAEYLTAVFNAMLGEGSTPPCWGQALLTLIYKGGGRVASDWSSYRPLAVTQVIAKIYACLLHARLSTWAESHQVHTPLQVGFRPGHSTTFNNFVLQHMIHKCKSQRQPLFCCFLDLRKAFDSVVRSRVWQRMYDMGVRGKFLHAVVSLYQDVSYRVKFSNGLSPAFCSNVGLRQGCPLSPILFSFVIQELPELVEQLAPHLGPKFELGVDGQDPHVPVLMFADDTAEMECAAQPAQELLDIFGVFCDKTDMDISFDKTKFVVFNSTYQTDADRRFVFRFRGQPVERASEYVFLGLLTKSGNSMRPAMLQHAASRGHAAAAVLQKRVRQLGLQPNASIMLRLFETVVMPNLTFGCEVWGPWILYTKACPAGREWWHCFTQDATSNVVEQMRLSFARTLLGLKSSTPVWNVFRELGWYPLQIYVAQQLVRFMNRLWSMPDNTIARIALLEMWHDYLLDDCTDNWCARVHMFLQAAGIDPDGSLPGAALDIPVYDERKVVAALRATCHKVFLCPGLPPKLAAYHADFGDVLTLHGGKWKRARYLELPLALHKLRVLARLRLSCHHLAVETGRWRGVPIDGRSCTLCGTGAVQDEHHVLFRCPALIQARLAFPVLFGVGAEAFSHVRMLFSPVATDFAHVARELVRFFQLVGGIYQSPCVPVNDAVHLG